MKRVAVTTFFLMFGAVVSTSFGLEVTEDENRNRILNKAKTLSMPFIENVGQLTSNEIRYYANTFGGNVSITVDGRIIYSIPAVEKDMKGCVISENFIGASISKVKGERKSVTKVNYFKGKSRSKWRNKISTYDLVNFGEIYKGIEFKLKAHGNNIEKLVFVHPGAKTDKLMIKVKGAKALKINEKGELELNTELGTVKFTAPVAYQEGNGGKQFVDAAYRVEGDCYGFTLGNYDKRKLLVIDPLLASTFIGGADSFEYYIYRTLSMDNNGNLFVTGKVLSTDFPTTPGAYDEIFSDTTDAFVAKLDNDLETLLASTFLGGSGDDQGNSISIDSNGDIYITGEATASDFPTTIGGYDTTFNNGDMDAFVAKLDNNLETLLASTFLGGSGKDQGRYLVIDNSGNIYVTGETRSSNFPTTPTAFDTNFTDGYYHNDIFISKFDSNLENLLASTFVGGSGPMDNLYATSIGSDGSIYIGGGSSSSDFPTTPGAYDTVRNSPYWNGSGFISRFDSRLSNLLASTFLEGTTDGSSVHSIDFDSSGNVYVIGSTKASNFPTTPGAYDIAFTGSLNTFISKLDGNLENLLASTFLGTATTRGYAIDLDNSGNIYVAGITGSSDFPTTPGVFDNTHNGDNDIYISKFDNNLESLLISTFIGGSGADSVISLLMDEGGAFYADGCTNSSDFPVTPDAYDPSYNISPDYNTFVLKIDYDLSVGIGPDPDLNMIYPNGGEVLTKGEDYTLSWDSDNVAGDIQIDLYKGGTEPEYFLVQLAASAPNAGSYPFNPPDTLENGIDYKIGISAENGTVWDFSDGFFAIETKYQDEPLVFINSFVTRFYQLCLDRDPDAAGLNTWATGLLDGSLTGSDLAKGLIYSPEFIEKNTSNEEYLTILYKAFFNRDPDPAGWDFWLTELDKGKDRGEVLDGFILANEFTEFCHQYGIKPTRTLLGFITGIVYDTFTKEPLGNSSIIINSVLASKVNDLQIQCQQNGRYVAHALQPGTYSLAAQAPGYVSKSKSNILIQEAGLERVNFYLAPVSAVADFVTRFYQLCLGREPDPGGLAGWLEALINGTKSGADVAWGFVFSPEFKKKVTGNEEYLTILYRAFFNREADQEGRDGWLADLEKGSGRDEVLKGFIYAEEFKKLCEDYGIIPDFTQVRNFVTRFYQQCLGRDPDAAGLSGWVKDLRDGTKTGADVAWGFVFSSEFIDRKTDNDDYLMILFKAFFNRDPDPAGWDSWLGELNAGRDRGEVLDGFLYSQEFRELCEKYEILPY